MPTVNLLPNGTVSNDWTATPALSLAHDVLDEDVTGPGAIAADGSCLKSNTAGDTVIVEMENFTADHSSINSVTGVTRAGNSGRGASFELTMKMATALGTLYTEDSGTYSGTFTYPTAHTYTTRTTTNGTTAWSAFAINGLRMRVELKTHSGGTTQLTYCYYIVDYNLPLATDNSVFFGTNF